MKNFLRTIWMLTGDHIADWFPGVVLIVTIFQALRARRLDIWTIVGLLATVASYISCHEPLPKPFDVLAFPRPPTSHEGLAVSVENSGGTVQAPPILVTPNAGGEAFRSLLYRVTNVPQGDSLRVRKGPGMQFDAIGDLSHNASGIRMVSDPVPNELDIWAHINHGNLNGWVHAEYLKAQDGRSDAEPPSASVARGEYKGDQKPVNVPSQLIKKLEVHCVNHFNTEGRRYANYQIVEVKQSRVESYDGKKATIRIGYAFAITHTGERGTHQRVFRLRRTWGDFWQVEFVSDAIKEPFPAVVP